MPFADNDLAGRAYIKQLMEQSGLTVRQDKMGNIYGTLPGADPAAAAVGTGSHCDAIPLAGAYDGTTGGASLPCSFSLYHHLLAAVSVVPGVRSQPGTACQCTPPSAQASRLPIFPPKTCIVASKLCSLGLPALQAWWAALRLSRL